MSWSRFSLAAPRGLGAPTDRVSYGDGMPTEEELRLLGPLQGARVLDLGCGAGHTSVALALAGAKVIAVDPWADQVAAARATFEEHGVRVEVHHCPLAELAFLRADSLDAVYSGFGLASVGDIDRVFRQVHRVLRPERPLVAALPHPALLLVDPGSDEPLRLRRRWWDGEPVPWSRSTPGAPGDRPRGLADLAVSLGRANFRIDTVLEPEPEGLGPSDPGWSEALRWLPSTLVLRARKLGL